LTRAAYHWLRYEEGLVRERKRKRRPKLRVIAGGGGQGGVAAGEMPVSVVPDEGPLIPPMRLPTTGAAVARQSAAEAKIHRYYEHQHERRQVAANVDRLRHAIVDLAAIELPPARLLAELSPNFDRPVIRERLIRAIDCLSGFAEAWCRDEQVAIPECSGDRES
jgi:hypothetical protein